MPGPLAGQAQTVLGAVAPDAVGVTLPHEHLLIDLNVIMGAGYYVAASHPTDMNRRTVDELAREMIADVTAGVGDTGIRSGLIGEIGTTYPWTENEKKVLRAAIIAQRETGAPLMIHPGRHPGMPMELAEFVRKEGGER